MLLNKMFIVIRSAAGSTVLQVAEDTSEASFQKALEACPSGLDVKIVGAVSADRIRRDLPEFGPYVVELVA